MGLSFLSPLYFAGLALLAVPIAIHLLSRRTARERPFSDVRFIRKAFTQRSSDIRLEDRRLLLLRAGLIGLLALAFTRPVIRTTPTAVARSGEHTSLAVVIDDSFSMAAADNGLVRMDRARARIRSILGLYGAADEVTLITASRVPAVVLKRVDTRSPEIESELDRLEPSYYASDLAGGLRLAVNILRGVEDMKREIHLVTDMQALAWDSVEFPAEPGGEKDIDLFLIDVGAPGQSNTAVTGVRVDFPTSPEPDGHRELRATFRVETFGAPRGESVVLSEIVAGREEASVAVLPRPGQPVDQTFVNWLPGGTLVTGSGELDLDALPPDNRRYFVAGAGGERTILLVDGNPEGSLETRGRPEAFFVAKALEALAPDLGLAVRADTSPGELARNDFGAYHTVILVDVPSFTEETALALRNYVDEGGHLLLFLGPRTDPADYNRRLSFGLLPGPVGESPVSPFPPVTVTRRRPDHPVFNLLSEEGVGLSDAVFRTYRDVILAENSPGEALAWFSNGAPALLERRVSAGIVIVLPSSPGPPWNNLQAQPFFVPFLGEVLGYLLGKSAVPTELAVGGSLPLRIVAEDPPGPRTVDIEAHSPGGEAASFSVTLSGGSARHYFQDFPVPGIYRFAVVGSGARVTVTPAAVAANLDPAESDLSRVTSDEALARLGAFRTEVPNPSALDLSITRARKGRPLWDYLLVLVLVLLVAETLYGNRVRGRGTPGRRSATGAARSLFGGGGSE